MSTVAATLPWTLPYCIRHGVLPCPALHCTALHRLTSQSSAKSWKCLVRSALRHGSRHVISLTIDVLPHYLCLACLACAGWPGSGRIEYRGVTAIYRQGLPPVLRNLTFTLEVCVGWAGLCVQGG